MKNCVIVVDLGSNSMRMGIYTSENGKIVLVDAVRYYVRLSEGLISDNKLKQPAMERTLSAFIKMKEHISKLYPDAEIICVATEAMRRAENSDIFKKEVFDKTGIDIKILSGSQETNYGLYGAKLSAKTDNFYMLDTGGGSFEMALCENGVLKNHICLPYGAVVLTEEFEPDRNGPEKMFKFLNDVFDKEIPWIENNGFPIVLLGGSNRLLGKLYVKSDSDTRQDGLSIPIAAVKEIISKIVSLTPNERKELDGMEKERADIIHAGLAPLRCLIERASSKRLIISTNSVREGIAAEYFNI